MSPAASITTAAASPAARKVEARFKTKTLTTPFEAPSSCHDAFLPTMTVAVTNTYRNGYDKATTTSWTLQLSSEAGCQPSGAPDVDARKSSYDPAVCPAGWTAYDVGASTKYKMKDKDLYFTASCCARYVQSQHCVMRPLMNGNQSS